MNRGLRQIVLLGMAFAGLSGGALAQPYQSLTLADVDGFTDDTRYPLGPLQAGAHGSAWWMPAAQPAHIVVTDDLHGKALRRSQTGTDQMDILHFPAVSNGVLRIQFEARASTAASRTLDIFLLPTTGGETCLLGWGTVSDQLCYYDGAAWIPVHGLDTNWHRIEMIVHLSGPQFPGWDLQVDDTLLATNLPWRNSHPLDTPYSRLRIGGIRGTSGTFADVDNLVITAEVLPGVVEELKLVTPRLADGQFSFAFATKPQREYVVQSATNAATPAWTPLDLVDGDGTEMRWTNPAPAAAMQFHRVAQQPPPGRADGYRGIWFTLGQFSQYGDKYSGGLGTYTANHLPLAVYAPAVNKTFFTYGGTVAGQRHLLIMASVYDHATGQVPRPTVVHDKNGVNDPHDNGSLTLDAAGYVWIFISGRARARPGFIYRSRAPYSVAEFDLIQSDEITYPQPWWVAGRGFLLLFTKYTAGRELYWQTSANGTNWSGHHKLAGLSGHYQVSGEYQGKICTYFNRHPGGSVDKRTDLYFLQTTDFGETWTTVDGTPVSVPVTTTNHPARVFDYASQGRLMYTCDLNFDAHGHPLLLYLTSRDHRPGPAGAPREWTLARWTGAQWLTHVICQSDHNYDMGSLYVLADRWVVIGPTQPGPQAWQTGGEMALWTSDDLGATWTLTRQITTNSLYNHTYARRPLNAADPFSVFWADGDPTQVTPSRLYFSNLEGTEVRQLPYVMPTLWATPERLP
ncbi:MAG: BNR-4 repeat-containing protein [Verrucomicrobia bacterium]|nr:BNR-4 repeat-containing protein [Verrucomicrobiota bacterium]